jgi:hypothetical protein
MSNLVVTVADLLDDGIAVAADSEEANEVGKVMALDLQMRL